MRLNDSNDEIYIYINILAALRTGFCSPKSSHRWDRELAQPSLTSVVPLVGPMQSQRNLNVKLLTQRETPNSTSPRRLGGYQVSPLSDFPPVFQCASWKGESVAGPPKVPVLGGVQVPPNRMTSANELREGPSAILLLDST